MENIILNIKETLSLGDISTATLLSIFFIVIILFIFKKVNNFYLISFLTLPGTFMHELMHYIASLLTFGKPVSFTIIPKRNGNSITLGSVSSTNVRWYNAIIISLAPLFLFFIGYYLLFKLEEISNPLYYGLTLYFIANLFYAGMPSPTDWKLAIKKSWVILSLVAGLIAFLYLS
jgi:hypothetical protein